MLLRLHLQCGIYLGQAFIQSRLLSVQLRLVTQISRCVFVASGRIQGIGILMRNAA
ncbi:hypothetical protein D3C81_1975540 [compost metagenome]